jgi:hypothetical protein
VYCLVISSSARGITRNIVLLLLLLLLLAPLLLLLLVLVLVYCCGSSGIGSDPLREEMSWEMQLMTWSGSKPHRADTTCRSDKMT